MVKPTIRIAPQHGALLDRRWAMQAKILLDGTAPLLTGIAQITSPESLTTLDANLPSIRQLFEVGLQAHVPPYDHLCTLLKQLNKYLNMRGLYSEQLRWAQSLLAYFLNHEETTGESIDLAILNIIASGYDTLGKHTEGLELYEFMLDLYEDHPGLAVICYNAALACHRRDDDDQALEFAMRALEIDECYGNNTGMATTLSLVADLMETQSDRDAIFDTLNRAVSLLEHTQNDHLRAQLTGKLAFYTAKYADWTIAERLFRETLEIWRTVGDDEQLAGVLLNYANLLYETNRTSEALTLARESLDLFQKHSIYHVLRVAEAIATWESELSANLPESDSAVG